jgi:hypothetical protein
MWDVTPCRLAKVLDEHTASVFRIKEEARSSRLPDYTASHPKRLKP